MSILYNIYYAIESCGVVRLSPLHVNTVEEIERFLIVTKEIATL